MTGLTADFDEQAQLAAKIVRKCEGRLIQLFAAAGFAPPTALTREWLRTASREILAKEPYQPKLIEALNEFRSLLDEIDELRDMLR